MERAGLYRALGAIMCVLFNTTGASADSGDRVTIRVYNTFGVSTAAVAAARAVTQAVLITAGVNALWRECRTAAHTSARDRCDDVLSRNEIIVRVVRGPAAPDSFAALGDSLVETGSGRGVLATIFADRVLSAGSRTGADAAVLLGRAVAHEVGHLLIGSAAHSTRGLMRARWSDDELRKNQERDWLFSPRQATLMKAHLLTRAATALP
jgi:hypothetical protein